MTDYLNQLKKDIENDLIRDANKSRKTLRINKSSDRNLSQNQYSSDMSNIDIAQNNLEQEKLTDLSNVLLTNLLSRNELKNASAFSGGNIVGSDAIQDIFEESQISNTENMFDMEKIGLESKEGEAFVNYNDKLQNIDNIYDDKFNQVNKSLRMNLLNSGNNFENQQRQMDQLQEQYDNNKKRQDTLTEKLNEDLKEKQDELNILKKYTNNDFRNVKPTVKKTGPYSNVVRAATSGLKTKFDGIFVPYKKIKI